MSRQLLLVTLIVPILLLSTSLCYAQEITVAAATDLELRLGVRCGRREERMSGCDQAGQKISSFPGALSRRVVRVQGLRSVTECRSWGDHGVGRPQLVLGWGRVLRIDRVSRQRHFLV